MSGKQAGTYEIHQETVYLPDLHPRIAKMVYEILRHRDVICTYDIGSIFLNWNGLRVKPELGKVALSSRCTPAE